jgi:hypothetical protein
LNANNSDVLVVISNNSVVERRVCDRIQAAAAAAGAGSEPLEQYRDPMREKQAEKAVGK